MVRYLVGDRLRSTSTTLEILEGIEVVEVDSFPS